MDAKKHLIGVVPVGKIPEIVLKVVAAHVTGYLHFPAEILSPVEGLEYAHIKSRHQYDAGRILKRFESMRFENCTKVIAVLSVDLSVPIFTYVFGEARQNGRHALVSLFRLAKNNDGTGTPTDLLLRRTVKVALHELGHLFNIFHCDDTNCLMHFSGDLEDLDNTPLGFCNYCSTCF